jgi:hypothetical protein
MNAHVGRRPVADAHTTDRDAHKLKLEEEGYCLVEGVLSPLELDELREQLVRVAAEEVAAGIDYTTEDGAKAHEGSPQCSLPMRQWSQVQAMLLRAG